MASSAVDLIRQDQAAASALLRRARIATPTPPTPSNIIAQVEGSGAPPPTVADPKVTSSNTIWLATPPKAMDWAVPEKFTPTGEKGQKPAL